MYDVITIGSALADIFVKSSQFSIRSGEGDQMLCQLYGDKMEVDEFQIHTGGGGSNTAVGFARQGFRTAAIAEVGSDILGTIILNDFHTERVATNLVIKEKRERTGGSVILIGSDGGRTVMVHRGASSMLDAYDIPTVQIERAEWVHLSSISGQLDALKMIGSALRESKKLSWNPGKSELRLLTDGALEIEEMHCQVLLVNREEWELIAPLQERIQYLIPEIVITDGQQGGVIVSEGTEQPFESRHVQSVDDTGAGDAFGVGYITARMKGKSVAEAANYGVENATSVVRYIGAKAGLLYATE